jgi:uncharacterized protein
MRLCDAALQKDMILAGVHEGQTAVRFEREQADGRNRFTGYGDGYVQVNGVRHASSLVVGGEGIVADWPAASVQSLTADHFAAVLALAPEIVLLGTGAQFSFVEPRLLAPLYQAGVGVEVMDTQAACRTYNILLNEGRKVVAALIV